MLTLTSVSREEATRTFSFLAEGHRGRRTAIRELTHGVPELVFWIYPDGRVHDARTSHRTHPPRGFKHIIEDEPNYGGFLRGRVVRHAGNQLIAVYCRPEALASDTPSLRQFLTGVAQIAVPFKYAALVISDNTDICGTIEDLWRRTSSE